MERGIEPKPMDHRIVKTRLKHMISDQILESRIQDAVLRTNTIVQHAYFLLKYYIQQEFETAGTFDHDVAQRLSAVLNDDDVFSNALTAVGQGDTRGRALGGERAAAIAKLIAVRDELRTAGAWPADAPSSKNMSFTLQYSGVEMQTAYKNNAWMHYTKYIGAYVRKVLQDAAVAAAGVEKWRLLPSEIKKRVGRDVARCRQQVVFGDAQPPEGDIPEELMATLAAMVPPLDDPSEERAYDMKARWYRYVPYMIFINRQLQDMGVNMYSPLCLRTAFVPKHIHLDTQGMLDILLKNKDEAIGFKTLLEAQLGYSLPHVKGKNDLNKDIRKLVDADRAAAVDKHTAGHYRNAIWMAMTKLNAHAHLPLRMQGLRFNNMVTTDGYSVSAHYVQDDKVGQTRFNGEKMDEADKPKRTTKKRVIKKAGKADAEQVKAPPSEFPSVLGLPEDVRQALLDERTMLLCADPGKGNLLAVTRVVADHDGRTKKYPVVNYSSKQRRMESGQVRNTAERRKLLAKTSAHHGKTFEQLQVGLGDDDASHKSSRNADFVAYLKKRFSAASAQLEALYSATIFRRQAFRVFCGRKSADDKFIDRILKAFKWSEDVRLAMLYGNWGRNPNLKHSPPTPGISLRRRVDKIIPSYTTPENYTSSVCFDCGHLGLSEWCKPISDANGEETSRDVHQLLRCQNACCSRWWSRDVLGALNIGKQGLHCIQHGCCAPCFAANH